MSPEGWYRDPFGRHEARWISAGEPTSLVRDGETEAEDEPTGQRVSDELELLPDEAEHYDDLARADEQTEPRNPFDGSGALGIGFG